MKLTSQQLLYKKAKAAYYNADPIMSDREFDKLEDHMKALFPRWKELNATGVLPKKAKTPLAHPMPSLNKVYPDDLASWCTKNPSAQYIVMDKVDGASVQIENGASKRLVTRGNGEVGGNISFMRNYLTMPTEKGVFRTEAIVLKRDHKKWAADFDNPRNMTSGLLNRRSRHDAHKEIRFLCLGKYGEKLITTLSYFECKREMPSVWYKVLSARDITKDSMSKLLALRKAKAPYEIDGLVIAPLNFVLEYSDTEKPKGIVAFKENTDEDTVVAEVKQVIWQVSGNGRLTPKVEIDPQEIGGVVVKYATAHNAQWLTERKIGPGAEIRIVRSGGVIPKIVEVVKSAKVPSKPQVTYLRKGVHYYTATDTVSGTLAIAIRQISKFASIMEIDFLGEGIAEIAYRATAHKGVKLCSPLDYVVCHGRSELRIVLGRAGVGSAMAAKIAREFNKRINEKTSLVKLMVASQVLEEGMGERKLQSLVDNGIDMTKLVSSQLLASRIEAIPGWGAKSRRLFIESIPAWTAWYSEAVDALGYSLNAEKSKKRKAGKGPLQGQKVSFTGYRDKAHEAAVEAAGGEIVSFGSKTTILLVKEGGKASSKVATAKAKGLKVVSFAELENISAEEHF